jgi:hypothetical protein
MLALLLDSGGGVLAELVLDEGRFLAQQLGLLGLLGIFLVFPFGGRVPGLGASYLGSESECLEVAGAGS